MPSFFERIATNPKQLLLVDGIGALVSAFFLGVVLVQLQSFIGMPKSVLTYLAIAPCFFALYSFCCYVLLKSNWAKYLIIIAFSNLLYCCATIWLVYCYYESLTNLGLLYFVVELIIILVLVRIELMRAFRKR